MQISDDTKFSSKSNDKNSKKILNSGTLIINNLKFDLQKSINAKTNQYDYYNNGNRTSEIEKTLYEARKFIAMNNFANFKAKVSNNTYESSFNNKYYSFVKKLKEFKISNVIDICMTEYPQNKNLKNQSSYKDSDCNNYLDEIRHETFLNKSPNFYSLKLNNTNENSYFNEYRKIQINSNDTYKNSNIENAENNLLHKKNRKFGLEKSLNINSSLDQNSTKTKLKNNLLVDLPKYINIKQILSSPKSFKSFKKYSSLSDKKFCTNTKKNIIEKVDNSYYNDIKPW